MKKRSQKILSLAERSGKLPHTLRNDYLFKVVLQSDERILRSFLCSLLRLEEQELSSVIVTNSIVPGRAIDQKTVMMDIMVMLNNQCVMDLEMQNVDEHDWSERSLVYLCRTFDKVRKGTSSYENVMSAHHVGILNFELKHLSKEFYSHFYIINPKNGEIYSDKLRLSVLNLKYRELATEEDRLYGLDRWADAFLADTWEDFQMLAMKDAIFKEVADAVYKVLVDENQREALLRYEERQADEKWVNNKLQKTQEELQETKTALQEKDVELQEKDVELQEKDVELQEKDAELQEKDVELQEIKKRVAELEKFLAEAGIKQG